MVKHTIEKRTIDKCALQFLNMQIDQGINPVKFADSNLNIENSVDP